MSDEEKKSGLGANVSGKFNLTMPDAFYCVVKYNINGGSGRVPTDQKLLKLKRYSIPSVIGLSRKGYTFDEWNTLPSGGGKDYKAGNAVFLTTDEFVLYAKWRPNLITVSYSGNGSTVGSVPASITEPYGQRITVSSNTGNLVREYHTFNGWNTKNDGTGTHYNAGQNISLPSESITLYAEWKNEKYVDIPQDGNIGTFITYMGYHLITSKSSNQYRLREHAKNAGRDSISSPEYFALIDNRIVIATKKNIGGKLEVSIGDYVDVSFKTNSGTTITKNCIIGDFKGADAPNIWGHNEGRSVVEIIYVNYNPPAGYDKNKNDPWGNGRVTRIAVVGSYGPY